VTELDAGEVQELYGLRLQLEPPLAKDIVDHVRRRDLDDLTALAASMNALVVKDSEEWSDLNSRFHRRVYELSERRHAVRLVVQVLNLVEPYARVHAHVLGSRPDTQQGWDDVIEALRVGDAERLEQLIADGIRSARAALMSSMGPQPTQELD
jgi:DNA-binding GntR family transcriptional regulator